MKKSDIAVFIVWFFIVSIPLSTMMANHTFSLNSSKSKNLRKLASQQTITVMHFLGTDCECSKEVYWNLIKRTPRKDVQEKVFVIGKNESWVNSLKKLNYEVIQNEMDYFEKEFDIKAVPQLTIINGEKLLYSGGYTSNRSSRDIIEEKAIIDSVLQSKKIEERPIFGCINGTTNRKLIDPFYLKYKR